MNSIPFRISILVVVSSLSVVAHAGIRSSTAKYEHVDYSDGYGERNILNVDTVFSVGSSATVVVDAATGKRKYDGGDSFSGSRLRGTLYYDWNDVLSTKTSVSASTNDPVFVNREALQDFNIKVLPNFVLTVGGKYAEYYGSSYVSAWSAGGSYYRDRMIITYRYTGYNLSLGDNSHGHMLSLRFKDRMGNGYTQLWLGKGTSVHDYDWISEIENGDSKNVTIQRIQPLKNGFSLNISAGKLWYETPMVDYHGTLGSLGVTYHW